MIYFPVSNSFYVPPKLIMKNSFALAVHFVHQLREFSPVLSRN